MSSLKKINHRNALMQVGQMLEAIALEGNDIDIRLAMRNVCNLDDDLVERYWAATKKLVVSKNVVKLMEETGGQEDDG